MKIEPVKQDLKLFIIPLITVVATADNIILKVNGIL